MDPLTLRLLAAIGLALWAYVLAEPTVERLEELRDAHPLHREMRLEDSTDSPSCEGLICSVPQPNLEHELFG